MQPASADYPARYTFDPPDRVANWRPLVHWLLVLPHMVVLYILQIVSELLGIISWLVILFTGKLPEGIANLQVMYVRYTVRVALYSGFMREEYPPFAFVTAAADPGDDPRVRVDVEVALEDRNRLTTAFRFILAIPHLIALAFLGIALFVVGVIAFFAVLFTGRWPDGLRQFALGVGRWWLRVEVYILLLTDEYPPFSMD